MLGSQRLESSLSLEPRPLASVSGGELKSEKIRLFALHQSGTLCLLAHSDVKYSLYLHNNVIRSSILFRFALRSVQFASLGANKF